MLSKDAGTQQHRMYGMFYGYRSGKSDAQHGLRPASIGHSDAWYQRVRPACPLRNSNIGNSRTIPIVAMTARGDNQKEDYLKAGFADCIYKPFLLPDLLNLLSTIRECREDENQGWISIRCWQRSTIRRNC